MAKLGNNFLETVVDEIRVTGDVYAGCDALISSLHRNINLSNGHSLHRNKIMPIGSYRLGTSIKSLYGSAEYYVDLAFRLDKEKINLIFQKYTGRCFIDPHFNPSKDCLDISVDSSVPYRYHASIFSCIKTHAEENFMQISAIDDPEYKSICRDLRKCDFEDYACEFQGIAFYDRQGSFDYPIVDGKHFNLHNTPLQKVVMLLKRHRNVWSKAYAMPMPESIFITTLAADIYEGEEDVLTALTNIICGIEEFASKMNKLSKGNKDFKRWVFNLSKAFADKDSVLKALEVKLD